MITEIKQPQNLMDGVLSEMNRVRELIKEYEHPMLKGAGFLAASFMKISIQKAERAISSGNVIELLKSYKELQDHTG